MTPTFQFLTNLYDRALAGIPVMDGIDGTRDLDKECGYQNFIQDNDYMRMFRRGDVASRVVTLEPDECWKEYPKIYETEEERDTEFEKAVDRLEAETRFFSYLHRLDRISGILRYGVMLIGMDDGAALDQPAPGYDEHKMLDGPGTDTNIIYYRVFTEASVSVLEWETDPTNPRFNHPLYYNLNFNEVTNSSNTSYTTERVHWSRILHAADNLIESEILGQPRMENVWNRLMDLRKVAGGSGEMFWKGGFPGLSFEVDPKHGEFSTEERDALREDVKMYAEGLQRYITMVGVSVKSIAPQIADPTSHTDNLLKLIAMTKAIPMQTFMGSQQGQLDSPQDTITWRERIMLRKERYVTPSIIRPFIDRLIQVGALPTPVPQEDQPLPYMVKWEPMAPLNIMEQAKVAKDFAEALARYATSGAEAIIPRAEFLGKVMGYSGQQVQAIESAPPTEHSLVFRQLEGMTGSAGGNAPSSIPKVPKPGNKKDPSKTPTNTVQRSRPVTNAKETTKTRRKSDRLIQALIESNKKPTNIHISQEPAQIHVPPMTVNVPQQAAPDVHFTVKVPKQASPDVHVSPIVNVQVPEQSTPDVTVNVQVPEQQPPVVNVQVPEQPAPEVTVNVNPEIVLPKPNKEITVTRDSDGKITGLQTKAE